MNLNTLPLIEWPKNTSEPDQWNQLSVLIKQLEPSQKLWLSGYLAASAESNMPNQIAQASVPAVESQLTILYGSQTGNSESVAIQLKETAEATGLQTELFSLADFTVKNLAKKSYITLVISTHGEGEAPDDAELFYEQLFSKKAPELTHLNYSVLALGDSSYELYCQTGKEIDDRLADLGATRFNDRIDCDVDFEAEANLWVNAVVKRLDSEFKERVSQDNITTLPLNNHLTTPTQIAISRKNPYAAEILNIQKITGHGSIKNTFHIELAIDPEIIQYQPGDSLGIIAQNHEHSVNQLLAHWQVSGDELYQFKGQSADLKTLLIEYVEISQISKPFVQFLAKHIDDSDLKSLATSHQL
ncbi:MAG: flavodoxin domain-containing protein, partial [Marinicella sp.]